MSRGLVAAVLGGCVIVSGCALVRDLPWLAEQGVGQAEILFGSRSVQGVIDDPETDPLVKRRLSLVTAARRFAKDTLGLTVTGQYRRVVFLDSPAVVFVVSAAPRTSLSPYTWDYPVLGSLPYRGFFALEKAEALRTTLDEQGLDASVRPVRTYSLLGILPDPVVSPMLFVSDDAYLVETVIHELAHATVFKNGAGQFNEGLATFIGHEGRRQFIEHAYGKDSAIYRRMLEKDKDRASYAAAVSALAFDLRVLYALQEDLSEQQILVEKDAIFHRHQHHYETEVRNTLRTWTYRGLRLPDNNAELTAYGLYSLQQAVYVRAFDGCQQSMHCFLRLLDEVAREDDPETALAARGGNDIGREVLLP